MLRKKRAAALVSLGAVAIAAWLGGTALAAQRSLEEARSFLAAAGTALNDLDVETARAATAEAGENTRRARVLTSGPVWWLASAVPYAGRTPATIRGVTTAADELARSVLPPALAAVEEVEVDQLRAPDGTIDVGMLQAAGPPAERAASTARAASERVRSLPTSHVVPALASRRNTFQAQVQELAGRLTGASRALRTAPPLLGQDRPRTYLAFVQQTGESRGTGGLIGGYVHLRASAGRIEVLSQGSNRDLYAGPVEVPPGVPQDYVDRYEPFGVFETKGIVNLSPDLPVVARVLRARWVAGGGQPVDGVIMLDAVALEQILRGAEPIPLDDGSLLPPEELVEYLSVGQYADFAPLPDDDDAVQRPGGGRKDQLDRIAATAASRFASGSGSPRETLQGLVDAVTSGHVRMASDDPALGPLLGEAGVDGALPRGPAPVAYPVVTNASGSKLENFLERSITYTAGPCEGDRRRSTISVQLTSAVPDAALPPYLTIQLKADGSAQQSRDINVLLTVYGTPGADLLSATVDGAPVAPLDPQGPFLAGGVEAGLPLWETYLSIPPGQGRTLTLELEEPVVPGELRVPEQPLQRPLQRTLGVPLCG